MSTVSDAQRHRLYKAFEEHMGEEHANVLFDLLPPSGWADVARTRDLDHLDQRLTSEIRQLEQRMELRFLAVDSRFDALDSKFGALESRFDAALERGLREQYNRFLFTMVGVVSVVTALGQLFERLAS